MNYWLHRISHHSETSYPLLSKGFLSIGFSDFSEKEFVISCNNNWDSFENYFDEYWGVRKRTRYNLWRFITDMKKGDYVLVPSSGEFSIYEILEDNVLICTEIDIYELYDWSENPILLGKDGYLYKNDISKQENLIDLGFFRKVKPIAVNISRYETDQALYERMKMRYTNACITDLADIINLIINEFKDKMNSQTSKKELAEQSKLNYLLLEQYKEVNNEYYTNFLSNIEAIKKLLNVAIISEKDIKRHLYNMLYANAITCLETYLFEAFKSKIKSDKKYLIRFVETFKKFDEQKIKKSEIFELMNKIDDDVTKEISQIIFHRMPEVQKMYNDTFLIKFPDVKILPKAILNRHHFVHRNGKTTKGELIELENSDVIELCDEIEQFVKIVNTQLNDLK